MEKARTRRSCCKKPQTKPWVGKWWAIRRPDYVSVVKQDAPLTNSVYDNDTHETNWVFLESPGNNLNNKSVRFLPTSENIPIEDIPFPPVEYLKDSEFTEFELTENDYMIYDS